MEVKGGDGRLKENRPFACSLCITVSSFAALFDLRLLSPFNNATSFSAGTEERGNEARRTVADGGGWTQRGGREQAHSHFSWCMSKMSVRTQRSRVRVFRWLRVVSGVYFSTWGQDTQERGKRREESRKSAQFEPPTQAGETWGWGAEMGRDRGWDGRL